MRPGLGGQGNEMDHRIYNEPAGGTHTVTRRATGDKEIACNASSRRRQGARPRLLLLGILLTSLCLATGSLLAPTFAEGDGLATALSEGLAPVLAIGAPVLGVHEDTVQWRPVALESGYEVATSNDARGTADRTTSYTWIARTPEQIQSYTPTLNPGETVYVGVSADGGLTWSEEATVTAPKQEPPPETEPTTPPAPVLGVHGEAVQWRPVAVESGYEVATSNDARGTTDRTTSYTWIARTPEQIQSYTPTLNPGETVYVGVSADGGLTWSEEATVTAPKQEPPPETAPETEPPPETEPTTPPAPVLSVHESTISWPAVPGATSYELATILNPSTTRETTYQVVTGTSIKVPIVPGRIVNYGLAVNTSAGQGPWAVEVSVSYPKAPVEIEVPVEVKVPVEVPASSGKIIGTNDGAGWGPGAAKTILAGHITWNRVEIGASSNTLAQSLSDGFHVLGIVGNVDDGTPLSAVDPNTWAASVVSQLQANPGITIAEAGNEMFLKGGQANAVQYGRLYLAAVNAMKAAGIHTPLLFDMFGDYPQGSWSSPTSWSRDSTGGGWLHDAVNNVPGLAAAILANGMGTHPYGANGENSKDEYGTAAVAAEENNAKTILGSTPTFYITEFGYDLGRCGEIDGACSQTEQATKMSAAYKTFLADPHVAGIFAYQTHDDGTGQWGYMNNDNTTRPTYNIIAENATQQGQ
jgi:hypothetical protein